MHTLIRSVKFIAIFLLLFTISSCKLKWPVNNATQTKFNWDASVCNPQNYPAKGIVVQYNYQGNKVGGITFRMVLNQAWGVGCESEGGETRQEIPDRFYVNWVCGTDGLEYEGSFKLPRDSIIKLFRKGYIDPNWGDHDGQQARLDSLQGNHHEFTGLVAGLAPGGMVVIWLRPGRATLQEIGRFKATSKGEFKGGSDLRNVQAYKEQSAKLAAHKTEEMLEIEAYIKHHGIPYKVWEKNEPSYPWEVGIISEEKVFEMRDVSFLSEDGSRLHNQKEIELPLSKWGIPSIEGTTKKIRIAKLPNHVRIEWGVNPYDQRKEYNTEVALPKKFKKLFLEQYINPQTGKISQFKRIIIGIKKGGTEGVLWLDGPGKQVELMQFKAYSVWDAPKSKNPDMPSGYAIELKSNK